MSSSSPPQERDRLLTSFSSIDVASARYKDIMNKVRSPTRSGPGVGRSDSQPNLLSGVSQPEFSDTSTVTHRNNKRKQLDDNEYIRTEFSEMRKQMSEMMTMLKNLTTTQNEFTKKITKDITTIKERIDGIKSTTDNLTIEQNNIKSDVMSLRNANEIAEKKINEISHTVQLLKSEQAQAFSSNETQEDIIAEINERELRSKNIVISGIPEPTSLNKDQRISMDKQEVVNLLKSIDNDYPEPEKIMRLGKYDINKTRPIKAYFKSHEIAKSILRNQNNSKRDNIKIYSDQTPKQRTFLQNLKEELNRRSLIEHKNLTIKYINGIPKIMEKPSKN